MHAARWQRSRCTTTESQFGGSRHLKFKLHDKVRALAILAEYTTITGPNAKPPKDKGAGEDEAKREPLPWSVEIIGAQGKKPEEIAAMAFVGFDPVRAPDEPKT
jgi:hypothetical protein